MFGSHSIHIGGAQLVILPIIENVTLAMVDRFSAGTFWSQVRRSGATHIHYLGGILQILLKQPESDLDRQHSVRIAWGGGCLRMFGQSSGTGSGWKSGSAMA